MHIAQLPAAKLLQRTICASTTSNNALDADCRNISLLCRAAGLGRALDIRGSTHLVAGADKYICATTIRAAAAAVASRAADPLALDERGARNGAGALRGAVWRAFHTAGSPNRSRYATPHHDL